MSHPYPPHRKNLPYAGRRHYFLTFCTDQRNQLFVTPQHVGLVRTQILRGACEEGFEISAYCFMPDHLHLIVAGRAETSDARRFIKLAKQYSGYYFARETGIRLWQRYGFERVMRDDRELALTTRYLLENPVRAGLVEHPAQYPYLGSDRYTVAELLLICEYRS